MMILLPLCDFIEWVLVKAFSAPVSVICAARSKALEAKANTMQRQYTGLGEDSNTHGTTMPETFRSDSEGSELSRTSTNESSLRQRRGSKSADDGEGHHS